MNIIQKETPNFSKGRGVFKPEKIILHIMDGTLEGTDSWFASPISKVSANFGIGFIKGKLEIHQYVQEEDTAQAQGILDNPNWTYRPGVNPNKYCLSIEHEGRDLSKAPEEIINESAKLVRSLATRWNIPITRDNIRGHYEIRATKPNCPATDKTIIDKIIERAKINTGLSKKEIALQKIKEAEEAIRDL